MTATFRGPLEEVEDFERKLAKKLVHVAEHNYENKLKREISIVVLKHLAAMARECEERKGDRLLGRIGRPT
ncbi:MAG TPA: hypothetical protein EYH23_01615 [Euryarchaeota archaeon]|nr:hypothetical protein [Euryarchaeota archaeon]